MTRLATLSEVIRMRGSRIANLKKRQSLADIRVQDN